MRAQRAISVGFRAAVLAALLLSGGLSAAAQGNAARARRTFAERVEVRVINLEAVVVDRSGRRVAGLEPGEFSLEVDGKPVPIEFFSEIADGVAVAPGGELEPVRAAVGERVGTSYLVFIDSYFTKLAARRNKILREIEANVSRLGPADRMAVVAFDGRKLSVLSSWSQSPEELAGVLAEARELPARGFITGGLAGELDRGLEVEEAITDAIAEGDAATGEEPDTTSLIRSDGLPTDVCATIARLERRIERAVVGVSASLRSFAQPPGRKILMLLSGGWPHSAKDYLAGGLPFGAIDCPDRGPSIYRPIYETANRLGYTLYPIDVPPPAGSPISPEEDGQALFSGGAASGLAGGEAGFTRTFEVHSTLHKLAEETGGTALIDGASNSAFDRVIEDTRTYYWLGFTPQWKGDDKSHKIKLSVARPGLKVRNRQGYVDLSRQAEISFATESALLFGDLPGSHKLGLEIGAMPRRGRNKVALPLKLVIPMDAITMLHQKRGFVAELELRVAVVDDGGNRNDMPVVPINLEGAEPPPPGAHAIYETSIKIRRRPHDIVVSIYDPLSDTILAATGVVTPGS